MTRLLRRVGWPLRSSSDAPHRTRYRYGHLRTIPGSSPGIWNEPDNENRDSYGKEDRGDKVARATALLPQVFAWARAVRPAQPLTSGGWGIENNADGSNLSEVQRIQPPFYPATTCLR